MHLNESRRHNLLAGFAQYKSDNNLQDEYNCGARVGGGSSWIRLDEIESNEEYRNEYLRCYVRYNKAT